MAQPGFFLRRGRGFTLIEVAIVIVILALLLAMLLGISTSMIAQQRRESTKSKLANVETALALFVSQNRRLPCPADGSMTSSNANFGKEISTGSGTTLQCNLGGTANSQQNGVVPWIALGLTEADVTDGWGTRLTYRVDASLVRSPGMNFTYCDPGGTETTPPSAPVAIDSNSGYCNSSCSSANFTTFCRKPELAVSHRGLVVKNLAGTTIMDPTPPVGVAATGAAYILISHGENRQGGFDNTSTIQGAAGPGSGTEEAKNAANVWPQTYYVDDFPVFTDGAGHFDDFVVRPTILGVATKAQLGPRAH